MDPENFVLNFDFRKLDCYYADLRVEEFESTIIGIRNKEFEEYAPTRSLGAFLRVYHNGQWLYKFTTDINGIRSQFQELIEQSKTFKGECQDLFKSVPNKHEARVRFPDGSPYRSATKDVLVICQKYSQIQDDYPQMKELRVYSNLRYQKRTFKSSRGRSYSYDFADCGVFLIYHLRDGDFMFMDALKKWGQKLSDLDSLEIEARDKIKESHRHLKAPAVQPGKYEVVLNSKVVGVFTHESFGHKSEADFMLGNPQAKEDWKLGSMVANDAISIVDYGAELENSGYCPFDDEGVETQKTYLIRNGKLTGRLHSLETAFEFGEEPTGNARAIDFQFEPIVRMTNTYIEPGKHNPDDIISSVKDGLYIADYRHGSGLSTFTIAPIRSYRIRDGKIADPVKVSVISGDVFKTLNQIEKVGNDFSIESSVFGGCGKDEQAPLRVADGGPTILVKEMQVG